MTCHCRRRTCGPWRPRLAPRTRRRGPGGAHESAPVPARPLGIDASTRSIFRDASLHHPRAIVAADGTSGFIAPWRPCGGLRCVGSIRRSPTRAGARAPSSGRARACARLHRADRVRITGEGARAASRRRLHPRVAPSTGSTRAGAGRAARVRAERALETPFDGPIRRGASGRSVAPAGFAWTVRSTAATAVQPRRPHVRVTAPSSASTSRRGRCAAHASRRAWPSAHEDPAARPGARSMARVLAAGDAAGLVKPTTAGHLLWPAQRPDRRDVLAPRSDADSASCGCGGGGRLPDWLECAARLRDPHRLKFRRARVRLTDRAIDALVSWRDRRPRALLKRPPTSTGTAASRSRSSRQAVP